MSPFGLKNKNIDGINGVFKQHPEIEKAIIYGSRANGSYRNGSDIDLTLTGEGLNLTKLFKIENELDDLLLPYKIDLSLLHEIKNSDLLKEIETAGVLFYSKTKF